MKKSLLLTLIAVLIISVFSAGCSSNQEEAPAEEAQEEAVAAVIENALTGQTEKEGFDPAAAERRVAAFVVENTPDSRPQWGMDDPDYSPDIILQGEVEGGITRTLWLYADYTKLPEIIGPMRSARPPYIRFSELFDSIFIHWGQSSSKGEYVGANTVFKKDKVDHINQMTFKDEVGLYDRDHTRNTSMEHRGILYGSKVPDAINSTKIRKKPKEYSKLSFYDFKMPVSVTPANEVRVDFSDRTDWETTVWKYNPKDKKYHTSNFENDLERDNLLILFDKTEYVDKANYKGEAGHTVTYCDYKLGGGKGKLISYGTAKDIEWSVVDGKLVLTDPAGTEAERQKAAASAEGEEGAEASEETAELPEDYACPLYLNPGKTWIGWLSSNHNGRVSIN